MPAFFEGMGMSFDTAFLRSVGYYKTVLYPRKDSSDSSHIPQPAIAGLGFAPFATLTYAKLRLALRAPSG